MQFKRGHPGRLLLNKDQVDEVLQENYELQEDQQEESDEFYQDEVLKKKNKKRFQEKDTWGQVQIDHASNGNKTQTVEVKQSIQLKCQEKRKFKLEKNTNRLFARILIKYIDDNYFQFSQATLDMLIQYDKKKIRCSKNEDLVLLLKNPEIGAIGKHFFENEAITYIQTRDKQKNLTKAIRSLKTAFLMCCDEEMVA